MSTQTECWAGRKRCLDCLECWCISTVSLLTEFKAEIWSFKGLQTIEMSKPVTFWFYIYTDKQSLELVPSFDLTLNTTLYISV